MKSRTIGVIVFGPSNIRGRYNYISLETESKVDGQMVSVLPLTDNANSRVEELGIQQHQPYRESKMLRYEWRPGINFDVDDYELLTEKSNPTMIEPPVTNQHATDGDIEELSANQGAYTDGDEQDFSLEVINDIDTSSEGEINEVNVEDNLSDIEALIMKGLKLKERYHRRRS